MLPITLSQIEATNTSNHLLNEIFQITYPLHHPKQIS